MATQNSPYTELTTQSAVEKLMSPEGGTALIDFWAPWCGPCRTIAPHFEEAARHYGDAEEPITFYKLNTESHPHLARAFQVRALPTILFIHNGDILDGHIGMIQYQGLCKKVELLLSKARGEGFFDRLLGRKKSETKG